MVRKQADAEGSPSRVFPPALARGVGLPHVPAGFTARGREKVLECSMTTPSFCSEDARPPERSWSLPRIPGRKEGVLGPRPARPPVARAARALRLLEMQLLHLSRVTCPAPVLDFSISISLFLQVVEDADGKEDRQTDKCPAEAQAFPRPCPRLRGSASIPARLAAWALSRGRQQHLFSPAINCCSSS